MSSNPQETLQNLIQKYNLIKIGPDNYNEFYRPSFFMCIPQCGYLLRFDKTEYRLITARSVNINCDGNLIYLDNTDYDPYTFEVLIKDCYNLLKSIKEKQLQKKLERIKDDF